MPFFSFIPIHTNVQPLFLIAIQKTEKVSKKLSVGVLADAQVRVWPFRDFFSFFWILSRTNDVF
jgi:hypothetical protein